MNNGSNLSMGSSSFPSSGGGPSLPLLPILVVIFGLGAIIFAFLTYHYYSISNTATTTLNTQTAAAAKASAAVQKKTDDHDFVLAGESPFRAFTAPDAYGAFVINFPKDWSGWVDEEQSGIQVTLILNPNFVTHTNGIDGLAAARITLQEETGSEFIGQYTGSVKEGQIQQSNITVSGQPGYNFTGTFPNQRAVREVVVPVRDKVLVFDNENASYASEFDQILAQAKINP